MSELPITNATCVVALRRRHFSVERQPVAGAVLRTLVDGPAPVRAWTIELRTLAELGPLMGQVPTTPQNVDFVHFQWPGVTYERVTVSGADPGAPPVSFRVVRLGPGRIDVVETWEVTSAPVPAGAWAGMAVARALGRSWHDLVLCLGWVVQRLRGRRLPTASRAPLDW